MLNKQHVRVTTHTRYVFVIVAVDVVVCCCCLFVVVIVVGVVCV